MELVDIEQNTPEWHEWRSNKIGASDASIILKESPWKTPFKLWKEKIGLEPTPFISPSMIHGSKTEASARALFEEKMMQRFPACCVQSDEFEWMIASLDGLSDSGEAVELKCPYSKDRFLEMVLNDEVPKEYIGQLQHQLCVTGLPSIHFFAYFEGEFFYKLVERDEKYIERLIEEEKKFYGYMTEGQMPPHGDKDYLENTSKEWFEVTEKLKNVKRKIKALEEEEETLKNEIFDLAKETPTRGNGVSFFFQVKKGGLKLKDLEEDIKVLGLDLNDYKKSDSKNWIVRISD